MNPARALPLILVPLVACDPDSLASGERLEEMMGTTPAPTEPAFEVRWFAGSQRGLMVDCDLVPAEVANDEDVIWGTLSVDLPEEPDPPVWLDWEEYSWALGLMVLVDRQRYSAPVVDDYDLESPRVWGAASKHALLYIDGDIDQAVEELLVVPDDAEPIQDEVSWVELVPAVIAAQDTFVGGLSVPTGPLSEDHEDDDEELLPITSLEYFEDDTVFGVLSGEALAGLELAGSCE